MDDLKDKSETGQSDSVLEDEEMLNPANAESQDEESEVNVKTEPEVTKRSILTLIILVLINLLNYMDRYTIAGVLTLIQNYFNISNKTAGLIQTVFTCSYMVFAPLFGYLGDRYSRKYVMAVGIMIWSVMTFLGSIVNKDQIVWFFVLRGLVGIGEASYSTVAPTIIADVFVGDSRTKALSIFYFAIPCGSGLGYIVGSKVAKLAGNDWQWAFKVTPCIGVICVFLCVMAIHEPKRGAVETDTPEVADLLSASIHEETSSYWDDIKYLFKVKSFLFASLGSTCISFVVGSLAFWAPKFFLYAELSNGKNVKMDDVSYLFGIVTFVTGVVGVWLGSEISRRYRRINQKSDAIVCGVGVFASIPFLYFSLYLADKIVYLTWVLIAIGEVLLFLNWAPNGDLLLYVIIPSKRSTAEAVQILFMHLFGDATSPFIVGAIADAVRGNVDTNAARHRSLLYALFITPFVSILGAVSYQLCANYLVRDREAADAGAREKTESFEDRDLESLPPPRPPLNESNESLNEEDAMTDDQDGLIPDHMFSGESRARNPNWNGAV